MAVKGKIPAWATRRNAAPVDPQAQAGGYGYQPAQQLTKNGPAGYYQTGSNERREFMQGGNIVRMAPNSSMAPPPRISPLQQLFNSFEQSAMMRPFYDPAPQNYQPSSVRGSVTPPKKRNRPAWA